jgi:formyltetrahydrofolate deformylase
MVSRLGHCLNDLLFRVESGSLPVDVPAIVSNHEDFRSLAEWHGIPFHHVPVTPDTKPAAEAELRRLVELYAADTIALARYMQILSSGLCADFPGRIINIHHSLLPSVKGAKPYTQAHDRGVKVIGATAHYVTADLDEGPIIEQDFRRVDHRMSPTELAAVGQELEAMAFARALRWHAEHRVVLRGRRTIVFD